MALAAPARAWPRRRPLTTGRAIDKGSGVLPLPGACPSPTRRAGPLPRPPKGASALLPRALLGRRRRLVLLRLRRLAELPHRLADGAAQPCEPARAEQQDDDREDD